MENQVIIYLIISYAIVFCIAIASAASKKNKIYRHLDPNG